MNKENKKIHFHFGGCAGKYLYLLGIVMYIQENFDLSKYDVYCSGESAGALVALFMLLFNVKEKLEIIFKFLEEVDTKKTKCIQNWFDLFKKYMHIMLPQNAYEIASNRFCLIYFDILNWKGVEKRLFLSNDDLIDAIIAGGYIPIFGKDIFYSYDNTLAFDGGILHYISTYTSLKFNFENEDAQYVDINYNMFRKTPKRWSWLYTDHEYCKKIFDQGYYDAVSNNYKIKKIFK